MKLLILLALTFPALAQSPADLWTPQQLAPQIDHLRQKAESGDGSASIKLTTYPNHFTMLAYRSRSGAGELHESFADLLVILDGEATLRTGGTLAGDTPSSPGERHGSSVQGAHEQSLHKGDIVHIPAGLPHQMLLAPGAHIAYFVTKIQEK